MPFFPISEKPVPVGLRDSGDSDSEGLPYRDTVTLETKTLNRYIDKETQITGKANTVYDYLK